MSRFQMLAAIFAIIIAGEIAFAFAMAWAERREQERRQ